VTHYEFVQTGLHVFLMVDEWGDDDNQGGITTNQLSIKGSLEGLDMDHGENVTMT
jgi:hypothetical protein